MSNPFVIRFNPAKGGFVDFNAGGGAALSYPFSNPATISGCQFWYDANDTSTMTLSGSNVTQWNDKSGNGRNAVLYNTSYATYSATGLNSKPALVFGDVNNNGYYATSATSVFPSGNGLTQFVVFQSSGSGSVSYYTLCEQNSGYQADPIDFYENTRYVGVVGNFTNQNSTINYRNVTNPTIYDFTLDGTSNPTLNEYQNGGTSALAPTCTLSSYGRSAYSSSATQFYIGTRGDRATGFAGKISEIIVYNKVLSTTDRQTIEGYLAWKWGLQANLPTIHPYFSSKPMVTPTTTVSLQSAVPNLVFDFDSTVNVTSSGTTVNSWTDARMGVTTTLQATKPTITTNIFGTKPGISFGQYIKTSSLTPSTCSRLTLFIVAKSPSSAYFTTDGTWAVNPCSVHFFTTQLSLNGSAAGNDYGITSPSTTFCILTIWITAASSTTYRINGVTTNTVAMGPNTYQINIASMDLGGWSGGYTAGGYFGEFLLFSRDLTQTEVNNVEQHLSYKWGIGIGSTSSIATSSPYY